MGGMFANRWWIVFASACGLLVGTGSIMIFSFGVFLKPVTEDLGISRGDLSTALGSATWLTALACPVVGWLREQIIEAAEANPATPRRDGRRFNPTEED